ncbi:transcriptional repressor [Porphyromonadaceae bacterium W3.11]|nr:transcriptional repressor [Porphyromonadaceae bacterium W3.11]
MIKNLEDRLTQFGVRTTPVRELIYNAIANADTAYSLTDLETELETVDMSSISRNLRLFLDVGLIHQIQDGSGIAKYALTQQQDGSPIKNHAHFVCVSCEKTICLDETSLDISQLPLPEGFSANGFSLLLKGTCPECSKEENRNK